MTSWNANDIFDVGVVNLYLKKWENDQLSVSRMSSMVFCTLVKCCYSLGVARGNSCEMCDPTAFFGWDTHLALEKQSRAIPVHNTHPTLLELTEGESLGTLLFPSFVCQIV
ncbi:hypothetical protein TNIN_198151 [Trichonephila inaurata madagascariensis]|uniref:Uncharacterized protein n=1 Tax=Trichonephila inaurata madagascariensis TaxID=2747483 RepID=A0A8X6XSK3_9ARAC|nr:hypothetical protein TNIN_198151 [Trichonephila inaurata madagascariensis]